MAKAFEELYTDTTDSSGDILDWEWDSDEMAFVAHDSTMKKYILRPLAATLEIDRSEMDEEEEEEDEE